MEYDTTHPTCYFYLLAQCVKKAMFVALAVLLYNQYCQALFLSAFIQFISLMYYSYVRPFKSPVYNVIIIFEEFMTLLCFLVLFKYASSSAVGDNSSSQSFAKLFSLLVFILTVVPAVLALIELVRSLKNVRQVCNWNRDVKDEKEEFDSSEEEGDGKDDGSMDKQKNQVSEDSLVEKVFLLIVFIVDIGNNTEFRGRGGRRREAKITRFR